METIVLLTLIYKTKQIMQLLKSLVISALFIIMLQHVFYKNLNVSSKEQKIIAITKNLFCNGYMYGSINTLET